MLLFFNHGINVTAAKPKAKECRIPKKQKPFAAKNISFAGSDIVIVPLADVQLKIKDGYSYVNFSEVKKNEALRGDVIKAVVQGNYYSDLVLGGGQLASKSLCKDESCNKKSFKFKLVADEHISNRLDAEPEYAVMELRLGV